MLDQSHSLYASVCLFKIKMIIAPIYNGGVKSKRNTNCRSLRTGPRFSKHSVSVSLLLFLHKMYSSKEEVGSFIFILPFTLSNSMILFLKTKAERGEKRYGSGLQNGGVRFLCLAWICGGHVNDILSLTTWNITHPKTMPGTSPASRWAPVSSLPSHPDDPVWAPPVENICSYHRGTIRVGRGYWLAPSISSLTAQYCRCLILKPQTQQSSGHIICWPWSSVTFPLSYEVCCLREWGLTVEWLPHSAAVSWDWRARLAALYTEVI